MGVSLRVLVVDDDEADRVLLRRALVRSDLGAIIEEVASIGAALARIASEPPLDCVIVDLHLPDGSPEDIVRIPARSFAVLVVTGLDRESLSSLAVITEAEACFSKDEINGPTVAGHVRAAVALRRESA